MTRVAALLAAQSTKLAGDEALRDAEVLLCAALSKPRSYLVAWPDAEVPESAVTQYLDWITRRAEGVPVAYILGEREFWSLTFAVNDATLIPRADTELLVEQSLALPLPGESRVLDLGTGCGAIALALASERPHWQITGVDCSASALTVARVNAQRVAQDHLEWLQGSWFRPLAGRRFALVVSNPPYIAEGDVHLQQGDLRFEPRSALTAGVDGLDDIRQIIAQAPYYLESPGYLLLEHGFDQAERVRQLLHDSGFASVTSHRDLAGHERVSAGVLTVEQ